ncbi:hypothetical protein PENTCL1PPCAC_7005, partial [Pristionchus entomophagus]
QFAHLRSRMAPLNEESVQEVAADDQQVELTPEQKKEQLAQLMSDGKRELRAGNYEAASQKFGDAAEFAAASYGELDEQSFEPNFMYGRALVELSIVENDLFKTALVNIVKKDEDGAEEDGNESMTEEEMDEVREMVADALTENADELEKKETEGTEEETKEEKTEETKEEKEEETKEEKTAETEESSDEVATEKKEEVAEKEEGTEKEEEAEGDAEKEDIEDGDEEDEEEDLDNNQLAWESLEVAKNIADKMIAETSSDEWKRKKADVFVQLAQCTANDEKYELALEDLGRARDLLVEIKSTNGDRLNAEIYFHEGRINRLRNEFGLATECFNKAAEAMEATLAEVKGLSGDAPTDDQKEDMADLEQVIKDFKEKAEDSMGSEIQKKMVADMVEKEKQPAILTSSNANSDPSANDISNLVRKKRAHDESEAEGAPKKSKSEEVEEKGEENVAV